MNPRVRDPALKIKITSLGCRLNEAEMQSIATVLQEDGHEVYDGDDADVCIINTCVVTARSEASVRRLVANEAAKGRSMVIVAGCASESLHRSGTVIYVPNDFKHRIPEIVNGLSPEDLGVMDPAGRFAYPPPLRGSRTRAQMKIQDGCDNFCAYCIIPLRRGGPLSRPYTEVLSEFDTLLAAGYKEIVLTGVMIGSYLNGGKDISSLVRGLIERPGTYRVHLSSVSPLTATPELLDTLAHDRMVKHLHLSLQSGSDRILERMRRGYTRTRYMEAVDSARRRVPGCNITTDVIVGFPGETDADFEDTLEMIRAAGFSHVHAFRFSARKGTAAAEMGSTVSENVKKERCEAVMALSAMQKNAFYRGFEGARSVFLGERYRESSTRGFNEYYIPVTVKGSVPRNEFFTVMTGFDEKRCVLTADGPCPA